MKDKATAVILAWVFWPALDFYLGRPVRGLFKLLTLGGLGIWALVDAIRVTTMSDAAFDVNFNSPWLRS